MYLFEKHPKFLFDMFFYNKQLINQIMNNKFVHKIVLLIKCSFCVIYIRYIFLNIEKHNIDIIIRLYPNFFIFMIIHIILIFLDCNKIQNILRF